MNPNRGALLVDFDGTLADSLGMMWDAYCAFITTFALKPTRREFESLNGPPLSDVVALLRCRHSLPMAQEHALQTYTREIENALPDLQPTCGARSLLRTGRSEGWRIGIVTSNDRQRVESWLNRVGMSCFVDTVVAGDVRPGKPDPTPYLVALKRLECSAESSIAIEDSATGYLSAVAAGIRTLFYRPLDRRPGPAGAEWVASLPAVCPFLRQADTGMVIRAATPADMPFLFSLRNDPSAVRVSRTARTLLSAELHDRFRNDPSMRDKITLIAEVTDEPTGLVRFDREDTSYVVTIIIDERHRGKGLGASILQSGIDAFLAMRGSVTLLADVAEDNVASARLFRGCAFQRSGKSGRFLRFSRSAFPS